MDIMRVLTHNEAERMMRGTSGRLFAVRFTKRSNGAPRRMTCRLGVSKGVTGAGKKFNDRDHNLLTVHEFVSHRDASGGSGNLQAPVRCTGTQFRSVPLENVTWLKVRGREFSVRG